MNIDLSRIFPDFFPLDGLIDSEQELNGEIDDRIGELPTDLREFYTLVRRAQAMHELAQKFSIKMGWDIEEPKSSYQAIRCFFINAVRAQFSLEKGTKVGIRKGFIAVKPRVNGSKGKNVPFSDAEWENFKNTLDDFFQKD